MKVSHIKAKIVYFIVNNIIHKKNIMYIHLVEYFATEVILLKMINKLT